MTCLTPFPILSICATSTAVPAEHAVGLFALPVSRPARVMSPVLGYICLCVDWLVLLHAGVRFLCSHAVAARCVGGTEKFLSTVSRVSFTPRVSLSCMYMCRCYRSCGIRGSCMCILFKIGSFTSRARSTLPCVSARAWRKMLSGNFQNKGNSSRCLRAAASG